MVSRLLSLFCFTVLSSNNYPWYPHPQGLLARRLLRARQAILKNLGIPTTSNPQIHYLLPSVSIQGLGCSIDETYVCSSAGDGGHVLWTAVAVTQLAHPNCISLVYWRR
jgi:alpha-1,2-mannosyltransferase